MTASRGARLNLGAEAALAFGAAVAFFLLAAAIPIRGHVVLILLLGGVYVYVVVAAARRLGPLYAVPLAIAGGLAFDSFYIPPTREFGASDWQNWLVVAIYLVMGLLVGMLAAHAGRRADVSEIARSELADEQAALRRVATLAAQGVAAPQLLAALAEEAGMLLDVDGAWIEFYADEEVIKAAEWSRPGKDPPTFDRARLEDAPVAAAVRRSGAVQRVDDFETIQPSTRLAEGPRVMSLAGAPVTVEGSPWGLLLVWSQDGPLPKDTEKHLTAFTELAGTAIANSDARAEVRRLADQQAALRRVATLVAHETSPEELFTSVCEEMGRVLGVEEADMVRIEGDGTFTVLSFVGRDAGDFPVGRQLPVEGKNVVSLVVDTELPARMDDYSTATGTPGAIAKGSGVRSAVGCPIVVQGGLWGVVIAATRGEEALPADTESRIGEFTELVGTAIANAQARREVATLADEQAALRRVATLVAEGAAPAEMFAAVARELGQLLRVDSTYLSLYEPDDTATAVGSWSAHGADLPVGTHVPLDSTSVAGLVHHSGQPARLDDYQQAAGEVAEIVQALGIRSSVGAPVIVEGQPLGVLIASSNHTEPLPADTESRIAAFSELVATAISNTQARAETRRLAEEQAARRRVATLVAEGAPPAEVFATVARELGQLLGVDSTHIGRYEPDGTAVGVGSWSVDGTLDSVGTVAPVDGTSVTGRVHESGHPERLDSYDDVPGEIAAITRGWGVNSAVGAPIVVDGELWGVMVASSRDSGPLPAETESRIVAFTELVATAISNTEARAETRRLAEEQATLRRVATLVAQAVPPSELFGAVAAEVGGLLGVGRASLIRLEADDNATAMADWAAVGEPPEFGDTRPLRPDGLVAAVVRTGRTARIDDWETVPGALALGLGSSVGSPIVVEGRIWGILIVHSMHDEPLPPDTEAHLEAFTELVATAIANTEARTETRRLADEQAALRRVATLVAQDVPAEELFLAVIEEVGTLFGTDLATLLRYEDEDTATLVSIWTADGVPLEGPRTWSMTEMGLTRTLAQSDWPTRVDDWSEFSGPLAEYVRDVAGVTSSVGSPIIVEGRLWGALGVHSTHEEPVPVGTEERLGQFTELVATAISNTEARTETRRLAEEQAALRRVATLVAREAPASQVFAKVAEEIGLLLGIENVWMHCYEPDDSIKVVASWGELESDLPVGTQMYLDETTIAAQVRRTGRPARTDHYKTTVAEVAGLGLRSAVGSPIVVDGHLWGVMSAATRKAEPLPASAEAHIEEFTQLVATAISNLQARSDLAASRARILAAEDDERRRVVRDLHDGAQQRLVHTVVTLQMANRALGREADEASPLVAEALQHAEQATEELRELAHGILPSVLTRGGLRAGVGALASRIAVPVENGVSVDRLPPDLEATAYFIVAEALTNVAKHSHASEAVVTARTENGTLHIQVRDDGVGGAQAGGPGLVGLADRVAALDGDLRLESPADGGTLIAADLPIL